MNQDILTDICLNTVNKKIIFDQKLVYIFKLACNEKGKRDGIFTILIWLSMGNAIQKKLFLNLFEFGVHNIKQLVSFIKTTRKHRGTGHIIKKAISSFINNYDYEELRNELDYTSIGIPKKKLYLMIKPYIKDFKKKQLFFSIPCPPLKPSIIPGGYNKNKSLIKLCSEQMSISQVIRNIEKISPLKLQFNNPFDFYKLYHTCMIKQQITWVEMLNTLTSEIIYRKGVKGKITWVIECCDDENIIGMLLIYSLIKENDELFYLSNNELNKIDELPTFLEIYEGRMFKGIVKNQKLKLKQVELINSINSDKVIFIGKNRKFLLTSGIKNRIFVYSSNIKHSNKCLRIIGYRKAFEYLRCK